MYHSTPTNTDVKDLWHVTSTSRTLLRVVVLRHTETILNLPESILSYKYMKCLQEMFLLFTSRVHYTTIKPEVHLTHDVSIVSTRCYNSLYCSLTLRLIVTVENELVKHNWQCST
jgi:hypothetical protein